MGLASLCFVIEDDNQSASTIATLRRVSSRRGLKLYSLESLLPFRGTVRPTHLALPNDNFSRARVLPAY